MINDKITNIGSNAWAKYGLWIVLWIWVNVLCTKLCSECEAFLFKGFGALALSIWVPFLFFGLRLLLESVWFSYRPSVKSKWTGSNWFLLQYLRHFGHDGLYWDLCVKIYSINSHFIGLDCSKIKFGNTHSFNHCTRQSWW